MISATERGTEWLMARGLDPELAVKMGFEVVNHRDLGIALKIPFMRDGKVVTTQYRALDKKEFRLAFGSKVELWNADALYDESLDTHPLVIAEGAHGDGLALMQCGFQRVVAIAGWSDKNFEPDNYEPFKRHEAAIKRAQVIVVAQHADETGATMLRAISNFFIDSDVRFVTWPKGSKDANDTLLLNGAEAVVAAINGARPVDPPGGMITGFTDLPPQAPRKIWRIDWPELDSFIAYRSREISLLTGTPSAGKTTWATWVAHHLVRVNDIRVGLCLFETEPDEVKNHLLRLHGHYDDLFDADKYPGIMAKLDRHYRIVQRVDEEGQDHGMKWLKGVVHKLAARDGCNLIIIDPWNEIEHFLEHGESMSNYVNIALAEIRRWAAKYDVHIEIIAHPKKLNHDGPPTGYDIADAAGFANKPGMGWSVHIADDDDYGEHVILTCWKVRNRQATGCRPGKKRLWFDEIAMTYKIATKRVVAKLTGNGGEKCTAESN
jgi:twinkle protein